jgi:hypothetical protein
MDYKDMNNDEYTITGTKELLDTQDMGLAVGLVSKGYELLELESKSYSKRVTFRFQQETSIDQAAQDYWSGRMQVDAKTYWNEMKNLKTRLYSL